MPSNWRQYLDIHTLPPANKDIINIRMYQYPLKRSVFRTRPKVKPKENSWERTAYRRSAKLGRIHYLDITISIPLGLQPVETIHCGRYATPSRLIFYEAIRLLPNYSNLTAWKNITFFSVTHSSKPLTKRSVISCSSGVRIALLGFIWQKDIIKKAHKAYCCNFSGKMFGKWNAMGYLRDKFTGRRP